MRNHLPMHTNIRVIPTIHRQKNILLIKFPYDRELIKRFKTLKGAAWSNTFKSWYLPDTNSYRKKFGSQSYSERITRVCEGTEEIFGRLSVEAWPCSRIIL